MKFYKLILSLLIAAYAIGFIQTLSAEPLILHEKFHIGDQPEWSQVEFDDSKWVNVSNGLHKEKVNYWVRVKIKITEESANAQQAIFTSILGAYEIYWNDVMLASNGVVATGSKPESPGSINFATPIPQDLWHIGTHLISLRVSNYHSPDELRQQYFNLRIGPHQKMSQDYLKSSYTPLIILGGLLLNGIFFLLLYFLYSKRNTYILFSILCLLIASLLLVEVWKQLWGYTYDWHLFRLQVIGGITFITALLLPTFLIFHLNFRHKKNWLALFVLPLSVTTLYFDGFDRISSLLMQTSLFLSLLVTTYSCYQRKTNSWLIMIAILIVLLLSFVFEGSFQDQHLFPSFSIIIISVLVELIREMKSVQLQRNHAQILSAQLEINLLKKSIQPHFILNTLTSIEQWIEECPQSAIKFIDALADEFKLLNEVSSKQLIPLEEEIRLCKAHLSIMGFRYDIQFKLESKGVKSNILIPPAILHTLIENSFSHNCYVSTPTIFKLSVTVKNDYVEVKLISPLEKSASTTTLNTGTGAKYIESRLDESYKSRWQMSSSKLSKSWVTTIVIPHF